MGHIPSGHIKIFLMHALIDCSVFLQKAGTYSLCIIQIQEHSSTNLWVQNFSKK